MLVFFNESKAEKTEHSNIEVALESMKLNLIEDEKRNTCRLFSYKALIRATLYSQSFADRDEID